MSIDALVFCNCLETGSLNHTPLPQWQVFVHQDGCRECASANPEYQAAFGRWHETACNHDYGILRHCVLKPESVAGLLQASPRRFPVLLQRVLAAGHRQEDFLDLPAVAALSRELPALRSLAQQSPDAARLEQGLAALIASALQVCKPIVL